jgi:hypothetical protein
MRALTAVFITLAAYGLVTGHLGGAVLALLMLGLIRYASKRFAAQDRAYSADPGPALAPRTTQQILDEAGVECSGPKNQP